MMNQKSPVAGRKLRVSTCDHAFGVASLRPSTFDFRPATTRFGFTLIELVVTIVIIGIMALVTVQYLSSAAQVYARLLAQRRVDSELMDAVDRMRWEARTEISTLVATNNKWSFVNVRNVADVFTNTFEMTAGRDVTLNSYTLVRGVDRFIFKYFDKTNGVLSPATNLAAIDHVELSFKVTNSQAASEMVVNFFLREGFLK